MGRSIYIPHYAAVVAYAPVNPEPYEIEGENGGVSTVEPNEDHYVIEYHYMVDNFLDYAPEIWPSLVPCAKTLDRYNTAQLENNLCYMGVSEYGGMAAYWIVPKDDRFSEKFSENWVNQIAKTFVDTFGTHEVVGRASNGEVFYQEKGHG